MTTCSVSCSHTSKRFEHRPLGSAWLSAAALPGYFLKLRMYPELDEPDRCVQRWADLCRSEPARCEQSCSDLLRIEGIAKTGGVLRFERIEMPPFLGISTGAKLPVLIDSTDSGDLALSRDRPYRLTRIVSPVSAWASPDSRSDQDSCDRGSLLSHEVTKLLGPAFYLM